MCTNRLRERHQAMSAATRKVIAELDEDGFLVMDEDGHVTRHLSAAAVLDAVRRHDRATSKKRGVDVVTTLEWRNVPDDWAPPS